MRKITKLLWLSFSVWIMSFTATGCQKEDTPPTGKDRVIPVEAGSKESGPFFVFYAGHDGNNCPGCIMINGKLYHVECQGVGRKCAVTTRVSIAQTGTVVTATTTDTFGLTSGNFFFMPDRSLDYEDEKGNHLFLNIPSQTVYRDTTTLQFTFTGLSFSNTAVYGND